MNFLIARRFVRTLITFVIQVCFVITSLCTYGANRDTVLNTVLSKPFFYNVVADHKGIVYAGTSVGIFKFEGSSLVRFDESEGYITLGKDDRPVIEPNGIRNYSESKYIYLLPYPDQQRDEYHAGTNDFFYICSGGRMYIFDLVPYNYSYPNHSIRTISDHCVGTYSGIYVNGNKLSKPVPKFTDGYIREYDGRAFICYDWMQILEPEVLRTGVIDSSKNLANLLKCPTLVQFRDIYKSPLAKKFFISSLTDLLTLQEPADTAISVYRSRSIKGDLSIIGENKSRVYFTDSIYVVTSDFTGRNFDTVGKVSEPILDGSINSRNLFVLTRTGLYVINTDNTVEKLTPLSKAHSMELISGTEIIISTDNGLFRFNTVNRTLTTLISGVEFNRRALFIKGDIIKAGSINGLYSININDLDILARKNQWGIKQSRFSIYSILIVGIFLLTLAILVSRLYKLRKKLSEVEVQVRELNVHALDRQKIEQYIRDNLSVASLKSIADHFNSNNSQIYKLLEPEKPGSIIQKMRLEKVVEMRDAGKDVKEISEVTGLSESYVRKIKGRANVSW